MIHAAMKTGCERNLSYRTTGKLPDPRNAEESECGFQSGGDRVSFQPYEINSRKPKADKVRQATSRCD